MIFFWIFFFFSNSSICSFIFSVSGVSTQSFLFGKLPFISLICCSKSFILFKGLDKDFQEYEQEKESIVIEVEHTNSNHSYFDR